MMKTLTKKQVEKKGFIWLILPHCGQSLKEVGQELTQGSIPEEGFNAESVNGCCLRTCSPWLAQPAFLEPGPPA